MRVSVILALALARYVTWVDHFASVNLIFFLVASGCGAVLKRPL